MRFNQQAFPMACDFCAAAPTSIQAQWTWNGVVQGRITLGTSGHNPGDVYYLPLQVASPVASSGIYPCSVEVKATVGSNVYDRTVSGVLPVVVNAASSFGAGWSLGGIPSLVIGSTCVASNSYDDAGNTLTSVDNVTQWAYDVLDRKVQELDPLGNSEIYAYDALDRLTSVTDRDGQQIASSYDLLNRKTGETWYNASGTQVNSLSWSYDADNNLLTAVNNAATTTMTYDALDRLATLLDSFGTTLTNTYDAADNRTQVQDSFGAMTTRIFDVLNRIASLQLGGTGQTPLREDFTYTARDQVATQTRYSDLAGQNKIGSSSFGYDSVGRLTNLQHLDGSGNSIANYDNAFDLASRITSETLNGGTPTNYSYDVTNQLTDDNAIAYSYDLNGNRTMPGYTTGLANELTSDGIWNYFHDKNGNLVGKTNISTGETWNYGYDNRNRLISATQTTSVGLQMQATYVYDALGQRIEKDVTQTGVTTTTRFAYDRAEIWADLDASNALQTRYVRGEIVLELLARIANGVVAWVLADRMGSVRNVVDSSGAVIDIIDYDGYGNITRETTPANGGQYKYDGYRYESETGWYRPDSSTGRYFNPWTGNWMCRDPILFIAGDPNLYRYVSNNPANHTDPNGLACLEEKPSCTATDLMIAHAKKWAVTKGAGGLIVYLVTTYKTEGKGDPSLCEFHRTKKTYSWVTEDNKKKVTAEDKAPKPDGDEGTDKLGEAHATLSEKDGKWTRIDVDRPGMGFRGGWQRIMPAGREVTYRYWVINSDNSKGPDKSWTLKFEIDKDGKVTGGPEK